MAAPPAVDKEQIFGMAEKEMEYRVDLFNRLTQTCFKKCVENGYKESELNMGENSCIDRCVSKYWQLLGIVLGLCTTPSAGDRKDTGTNQWIWILCSLGILTFKVRSKLI